MTDLFAQNPGFLLPPSRTAIPETKNIKTNEQAREVSKEFEAVFLNAMLEHMIPETEESIFGGGSHAESIWQSLMREQYAELITKGGGVGIADQVYRELIALQEASPASSTQKKGENAHDSGTTENE